MIKKREVPFVLLDLLKPYTKLEGVNFKVVKPNGNDINKFWIKFIDKDPSSTFCFIIEKLYEDNKGKCLIHINAIPMDERNMNCLKGSIDINDFDKYFRHWLDLIEKYETITSFFDDPIIKQREQEFLSEFEFIEDEDRPLEIPKVVILDKYLEVVYDRLDSYSNENNSNDIILIQNDIKLLRDNIGNESRKSIITKVVNIWAKVSKLGVEFCKEFLGESKKEVMKEIAKVGINYVKEIGDGCLS